MQSSRLGSAEEKRHRPNSTLVVGDRITMPTLSKVQYNNT
jgi:hypothetical protein